MTGPVGKPLMIRTEPSIKENKANFVVTKRFALRYGILTVKNGQGKFSFENFRFVPDHFCDI